MKATVHKGPKGGIEYRLWTGEATFRVVSRFHALPHLTPDELDKASAMDSARKATAKAQASSDAMWRAISGGRGVLA